MPAFRRVSIRRARWSFRSTKVEETNALKVRGGGMGYHSRWIMGLGWLASCLHFPAAGPGPQEAGPGNGSSVGHTLRQDLLVLLAGPVVRLLRFRTFLLPDAAHLLLPALVD